jgi:hypothetical protein
MSDNTDRNMNHDRLDPDEEFDEDDASSKSGWNQEYVS